jgi:hypothetical protein
MKKSDLVRVIREVIRQEVKKVLKEELKKTLPQKEKDPNEFTNMMQHADELFNGPKNTQQFTNNPALNEALNQTATSKEEWPTMGGKTLTNGQNGLASMMGMESPDQMFGGKPSAQQMVPKDRQHIEIDEDLAGILTRDYTDLMKAVDKKKGI